MLAIWVRINSHVDKCTNRKKFNIKNKREKDGMCFNSNYNV